MKDDFDFSLYLEEESNIYTGSYYAKNYNVTLPTRVYNYVKDLNFRSIEEFYQYLTVLLEEHTSRYLFSGDLCYFYPSIREQKASKDISCYVSGAKIVENEFYYAYRPLIDNITSGKVYTITHSLKVSTGYYDLLPQNLHTFEELCSNFMLGLDCNGVNYYDFKVNAGDNALDLKLLSKRKRLF